MLEFLINNDARSEGLRSRTLGWRHSGFSAHNEVRVPVEDAEGRKELASTMLRAPMCLEQMSYDDATGTVIYRSKMPLEDASRVSTEFAARAKATWAG